MKELALTGEEIDIYFGGLLNNLDRGSKLLLIAKLTDSLEAPEPVSDEEPLAEFFKKYGSMDEADEEVFLELCEPRPVYRKRDDKNT